MKLFLLGLLSLVVLFTYSCGGDEKKDTDKVECKTNADCKDNKICNTLTNKCEAEVLKDVLTSIEVDIENSADAQNASVLVGEKKTVRAWGVYDNNETNTVELSKKVRWYSSDSLIGIASKNNNGEIEFKAKKPGVVEIYCKYQGIESQRVTFTVTEAVIDTIDLKSNSGNSIFLHQSVIWNIIATFEGGKQGKLESDSVEFHSNPEGLSKNENGEYKFPAVGNYDVWVTKDGKDSNHVQVEVKANIVTGLELNYDRNEGDFIVNTPHRVIVKETYEANGEGELTDAAGLEWACETRTDNGDGTYTPADCEEGDYEVNGFNITFKKAETFYITVSKAYTENTTCAENKCSGLFSFLVTEAQ